MIPVKSIRAVVAVVIYLLTCTYVYAQSPESYYKKAASLYYSLLLFTYLEVRCKLTELLHYYDQ